MELQAEPWVSDVFEEVPLSVQEKTMSFSQFKKNIDYARRSGLGTTYFWGVEWWRWMQTVQDRPEYWNAAKELLSASTVADFAPLPAQTVLKQAN